jgi:cation:H+ antiporter
MGSGFVIKSVEKISNSLRVSSFLVSFIILGAFTSVSEFSVGLNSILEGDPEIFVGNLIGASMILFLLIIPMLAVLGKSIHVSPSLQGFNLPASLVAIALPAILVLDGKVSRVDAIFCLVLFVLLTISVQRGKGLIQSFEKTNERSRVGVGKELLRILFGVAIIFVASRFAVDQTHYFANMLGVSPFLVSLVVVSLGTNLPELSLVVRSVFTKNHQVAFGDFMGSAVFNTLIFGVLTFIYGKEINLSNSFVVSLLFLVVGLLLFYHFARTKNTISRIEGLALFFLYLAFLFTEYIVHIRV